MRSERGGFYARTKRDFLSLVVVFGIFFGGSGIALGAVTINTDTLRIYVDGIDVGASLGETAFSAAHRGGDGAAQFTFHGDLDLAGQAVTFVGSRAASFVVNNNADLAGASFELSGHGSTRGGAGGGGGGFSGVGLSALGFAGFYGEDGEGGRRGRGGGRLDIGWPYADGERGKNGKRGGKAKAEPLETMA